MGGGAARRRLGPAMAACLVLCLAGCASSSGGADAPPEERVPEGPEERVPEGTSAEGTRAGGTVGSAPVGVPEGTVSGTWESEVELENDREQFLADCMADHGFEYVPTVYPPEMGAADLDLYLKIDNNAEAAIKFARKYGFEMFLDPDEAAQLELAGVDDDSPPDPNDAIFEALSDSEKDAYSRVLFDDGGCIEMMEERFPVALPPDLDDETAEALDAIRDEFNERLAADPRIADAEADRRRCLEEAGLPEGTVWAEDHMKERFRQAAGLDYMEVEGDLSEVVGEEVLGELRAEERKVAEIDARCRSAYLTVQNEVGEELEREVIEDHPEILDMLADSP